MKSVNSYKWAFKMIEKKLECSPEFTGRFEINFYKGSVANVNRLESLKPQPEKRRVND